MPKSGLLSGDVQVPKWMVTVIGAIFPILIVGWITQSIMLYAQVAVIDVQLKAMQSDIGEVKKKLDEQPDPVLQAEYDLFRQQTDARFQRMEERMRVHETLREHVGATLQLEELRRQVAEHQH